VRLMKRLSFNALIQNRVLLIAIAIIVLLTFGSVAFIQLNGADHPSSAKAAASNPQASDDPAALFPTQTPPKDNPAPSTDVSPLTPESPSVERETLPTTFSILDETICISPDTERQIATVVEALDTDKISVEIDGKLHTVRFLGIDTHVDDEKLREDVFSANEILVGKKIALIADGSDHDSQGNLLRYVFTDNAFINLALVQRGLASVPDISTDLVCSTILQEAQEAARLQEVGIWEPLKPEDWRAWPVIPEISETALDIYLRGLENGTNPSLFSIVGDCQNIPGGSLFRKVNWGDFSLPPELEYLQPTLENFQTIWSREPITVDGGFIPASMFSTYWTDTDRCNPTETPLECEFRQNNASILIISIGSDQKPGTEDDFDRYMRKIVEYSIEKDVLPILATDAYATAEDFPLNQIMAQIAYDYDIPLWNFWAAVQDLPNHGLKEDNFHISAEAFAIKRITGIQVLHAILTAAQE
jgi:endonuclease YncB( thermonuclease family)